MWHSIRFRFSFRFIPATSLLLSVGLAPLQSGPAPDFLYSVTTIEEFESLSVPVSFRPGALRSGKFTAPVSDNPSLLPTVYQDVEEHPIHYEFLIQFFPELFTGLTIDEYLALILRRETREYFSGGIYSIETDNQGVVYGFEIATDPLESAELLSAEETREVYERIAESFLLRPLYYAPTSLQAVVRARDWIDPGFPVLLPGQEPPAPYEGYTLGTNYGRVRLLTLQELDQANREGQLSWQDIVVLDRAPFELEGVVAALVTGERQAELSHVAIRMARRGTPNAFVENAHQAFAPHEGELVRIDLDEAGYSIHDVSDPSIAREWWAEHRPNILYTPLPDHRYSGLDNLLEMEVDDSDDPLIEKFGGKASNLAKMFSYLPSEYQVPGFAIPFKYGWEFMWENTLIDTRVDPPVERSYRHYYTSLLADDRFRNDSQYRALMLEEFQEEIRNNGVVDPELVESLAQRIEEVFGSRSVMVRFRSSSNAEDSPLFTGAGLYDSTSVCVEDSTDGDAVGPSRCDPNQDKERTIERGLKKVWASLHNFRAFDEREYFQIRQDQVGMAILVTPAFPAEAANGVGLTGDPILGATAGYVINVQVGGHSVVQPEEGVLPERDILRMASGEVVNIQRNRTSSLLQPGEFVLTDDQLRTLGRAMAIVDASQPIVRQGYAREDFLLDIEFKFTQSGDLIFKQVRPFLRSDPDLQTSEFFQFVIPGGTTLCRRFFRSDSIRDAFTTLMQVSLKPGVHLLSKQETEFPADLIDRIVVGRSQEEALPDGPGQMFLKRSIRGDYRYEFNQAFTVSEGTLTVNLNNISFRENDPPLVLDEDFYAWNGARASNSDYEFLELSHCSLEIFQQYYIDLQLKGGLRAAFLTVWKPGFIHEATVADLIAAGGRYPGGVLEELDYWSLGYANLRYLHGIMAVVFDPPLGARHGMALENEGGKFSASFLDENLESFLDTKIKSLSVYEDSLDVVINEVMLSNNMIQDESGEFEPWMELINNSTEEIALGSIFAGGSSYLSSDPMRRDLWEFPEDATIGAGEKLIVWLDGEPEEGPLHTSFRATPEAGVLILIHGSSALAPPGQDHIYYENPSVGMSEGRLPDGTGTFFVLENPTPREANTSANDLRIPGDTTGDRCVEPIDVFFFSDYWREMANEINALSDPTQDGEIDARDLLHFFPAWK